MKKDIVKLAVGQQVFLLDGITGKVTAKSISSVGKDRFKIDMYTGAFNKDSMHVISGTSPKFMCADRVFITQQAAYDYQESEQLIKSIKSYFGSNEPNISLENLRTISQIINSSK